VNPIDSSLAEYLQGHRAGILATTNRSGTPQQTLIGYRFDGNDIAISTRATSLKAKNVSKRPGVSLAITDGRSQLIVYGKAEIVRELDAVFALHRGRGLLGDRQTSDAEFQELLESEKRVVLVLRPEKFYPATMRRA